MSIRRRLGTPKAIATGLLGGSGLIVSDVARYLQLGAFWPRALFVTLTLMLGFFGLHKLFRKLEDHYLAIELSRQASDDR